MKTSGEAELLSFLRAIDARLDVDGFKGRVDLYVFGGAAAVIAYGSKRGTVDIDALVQHEGVRMKLEEWAGKGSALAVEHGLYFQRANTTLMPIVEPDWMERSVEILKGSLEHFRVWALGKEDLILSKLGRYNDRDRGDIQFIAEAHRVDVGKLIACYKTARKFYIGPLATLDQTFNIVLEEHFGHPPLELEA